MIALPFTIIIEKNEATMDLSGAIGMETESPATSRISISQPNQKC